MQNYKHRAEVIVVNADREHAAATWRNSSKKIPSIPPYTGISCSHDDHSIQIRCTKRGEVQVGSH